ncbi:pericentrin [Vicugna pacos]|uniref:Pericentrin n=1 Tax=Vicugna pacos TaxID=30538 RepID=A0ABM5E1F8_VICPA
MVLPLCLEQLAGPLVAEPLDQPLEDPDPERTEDSEPQQKLDGDCLEQPGVITKVSSSSRAVLDPRPQQALKWEARCARVAPPHDTLSPQPLPPLELEALRLSLSDLHAAQLELMQANLQREKETALTELRQMLNSRHAQELALLRSQTRRELEEMALHCSRETAELKEKLQSEMEKNTQMIETLKQDWESERSKCLENLRRELLEKHQSELENLQNQYKKELAEQKAELEKIFHAKNQAELSLRTQEAQHEAALRQLRADLQRERVQCLEDLELKFREREKESQLELENLRVSYEELQAQSQEEIQRLWVQLESARSSRQELSELHEQLLARTSHVEELERLRRDFEQQQQQERTKHESELGQLRIYFEKKLREAEKDYQEDVALFQQRLQEMEEDSLLESVQIRAPSGEMSGKERDHLDQLSLHLEQHEESLCLPRLEENRWGQLAARKCCPEVQQDADLVGPLALEGEQLVGPSEEPDQELTQVPLLCAQNGALEAQAQVVAGVSDLEPEHKAPLSLLQTLLQEEIDLLRVENRNLREKLQCEARLREDLEEGKHNLVEDHQAELKSAEERIELVKQELRDREAEWNVTSEGLRRGAEERLARVLLDLREQAESEKRSLTDRFELREAEMRQLQDQQAAQILALEGSLTEQQGRLRQLELGLAGDESLRCSQCGRELAGGLGPADREREPKEDGDPRLQPAQSRFLGECREVTEKFIEERDAFLQEAQEKHSSELQLLRERHQQLVLSLRAELETRHQAELEELRASFQSERRARSDAREAELQAELAAEIRALEARHVSHLDSLESRYLSEIQTLRGQHRRALELLRVDLEEQLQKEAAPHHVILTRAFEKLELQQEDAPASAEELGMARAGALRGAHQACSQADVLRALLASPGRLWSLSPNSRDELYVRRKYPCTCRRSRHLSEELFAVRVAFPSSRECCRGARPQSLGLDLVHSKALLQAWVRTGQAGRRSHRPCGCRHIGVPVTPGCPWGATPRTVSCLAEPPFLQVVAGEFEGEKKAALWEEEETHRPEQEQVQSRHQKEKESLSLQLQEKDHQILQLQDQILSLNHEVEECHSELERLQQRRERENQEGTNLISMLKSDIDLSHGERRALRDALRRLLGLFGETLEAAVTLRSRIGERVGLCLEEESPPDAPAASVPDETWPGLDAALPELDRTSPECAETSSVAEISSHIRESFFMSPESTLECEQPIRRVYRSLGLAVDSLLEMVLDSTRQLEEARQIHSHLEKEFSCKSEETAQVVRKHQELLECLDAESTAKTRLTLELHKAEGIIEGFKEEKAGLQEALGQKEASERGLVVELEGLQQQLQRANQQLAELQEENHALQGQKEAMTVAAGEREAAHPPRIGCKCVRVGTPWETQSAGPAERPHGPEPGSSLVPAAQGPSDSAWTGPQALIHPHLGLDLPWRLQGDAVCTVFFLTVGARAPGSRGPQGPQSVQAAVADARDLAAQLLEAFLTWSWRRNPRDHVLRCLSLGGGLRLAREPPDSGLSPSVASVAAWTPLLSPEALRREVDSLTEEQSEARKQCEKDRSALLAQMRVLEAELEEQLSRHQACARQAEELSALSQQMGSLDKQLRRQRQFMDEQAAEREQEREEFQQEILRLEEQLRQAARLQPRGPCDSDVELLEEKLREKSDGLNELILKKELADRQVLIKEEEIRRLEEMNASTARRLVQLQEDLERQRRTVQDLEQDKAALQEQQMSNLLLVSTLQSRLDEGKCLVPPAGSSLEGPEVRLEALQRALLEREDEVLDLKEQLEKIKHDLVSRNEEVLHLGWKPDVQDSSAATRIRELQEENAGLKAFLQNKEREMTCVSEQSEQQLAGTGCGALSEVMCNRGSEIEELKSIIENLRENQERLQKDRAEEVDQLHEVIEKLQRELSVAGPALHEVSGGDSGGAGSLKNELLGLQAEGAAAREVLEGELHTALEAKEALGRLLSEQERLHGQALEALQGRLRDAEEAAARRLAQLEQSAALREAEVQGLAAQIQEFEAALKAKDAKIAERDLEIEAVNKERRAHSSELEALLSAVARFCHALEQQPLAATEEPPELQRLRAQCRRLSRQLQALHQRFVRCQKELDREQVCGAHPPPCMDDSAQCRAPCDEGLEQEAPHGHGGDPQSPASVDLQPAKALVMLNRAGLCKQDDVMSVLTVCQRLLESELLLVKKEMCSRVEDHGHVSGTVKDKGELLEGCQLRKADLIAQARQLQEKLSRLVHSMSFPDVDVETKGFTSQWALASSHVLENSLSDGSSNSEETDSSPPVDAFSVDATTWDLIDAAGSQGSWLRSGMLDVPTAEQVAAQEGSLCSQVGSLRCLPDPAHAEGPEPLKLGLRTMDLASWSSPEVARKDSTLEPLPSLPLTPCSDALSQRSLDTSLWDGAGTSLLQADQSGLLCYPGESTAGTAPRGFRRPLVTMKKEVHPKQVKALLQMVCDESHHILALSECRGPPSVLSRGEPSTPLERLPQGCRGLLEAAAPPRGHPTPAPRKGEKEPSDLGLDWKGEFLQVVQEAFEKEREMLNVELRPRLCGSDVGGCSTLLERLEKVVQEQGVLREKSLEHLRLSDRSRLLSEIQALRAQLRMTHLQNQEKLQQLCAALTNTEARGSRREHQLRRQVELLAYKVEQEKCIASDLQKTLNEEQEKANHVRKLLVVEQSAVRDLKSELCECKQDNERLLQSLNDVQKEVLQLRSALDSKEKDLANALQQLEGERVKGQALQSRLDEERLQYLQREGQSAKTLEELRTSLEKQFAHSNQLCVALEHEQTAKDNLRKELQIETSRCEALLAQERGHLSELQRSLEAEQGRARELSEALHHERLLTERLSRRAQEKQAQQAHQALLQKLKSQGARVRELEVALDTAQRRAQEAEREQEVSAAPRPTVEALQTLERERERPVRGQAELEQPHAGRAEQEGRKAARTGAELRPSRADAHKRRRWQRDKETLVSPLRPGGLSWCPCIPPQNTAAL